MKSKFKKISIIGLGLIGTSILHRINLKQKELEELNKKESPRLIWGSKLLKMMGIKAIVTKDSIKIFGNPQLKIKKKIVISKYLKDHRVFMTSVIAALSFGGLWEIHNKESIKTSFPSFLEIIKSLKK